jgi:hypothetical protein
VADEIRNGSDGESPRITGKSSRFGSMPVNEACEEICSAKIRAEQAR